jgi:hypothetical protein
VKVKKKKFQNKDLVVVEVCSESGLKAGQWCPPEDIREKTFEVGKEPQEYCNIHGPNNTKSVSAQDNSDNTGGQTLDNNAANSDTNNANNSGSSTPAPTETPAPQVNNKAVTQTPSSGTTSETDSETQPQPTPQPTSQSESTNQ